MKSRRWIAAAALAAAVVFLVMVTGENGPAAPNAVPAPVSSSGAVLASDGGPPENDNGNGNGNGGNGGGGTEDADREEIIDALQGLLDALGISADELDGGAENSSCGNGEQDKSNPGNGENNGSDNGGNNGGNDDGGGANGGCEPSEPASANGSAAVTITIKGFAFGQPQTVAPGAEVEVVNTDAAPHNVTAADGSFKTSNLNQDERATFTAPTTPGRYEFTCTLHPEMTGTLVVEGNGGEGGSRSSEPATGSQRGGSGGDHDSSRQHPGRENTNGTSDGY